MTLLVARFIEGESGRSPETKMGEETKESLRMRRGRVGAFPVPYPPTHDSPRRSHTFTLTKQTAVGSNSSTTPKRSSELYQSTMGKGGDASAAFRGPMKLVGDKSEKITWSEVKKHVSIIAAFLVCYRSLL